MFDAVGHDPVLAGEAIARPALVDRLIHPGMPMTNDFTVRSARAVAALARAASAADLETRSPEIAS